MKCLPKAILICCMGAAAWSASATEIEIRDRSGQLLTLDVDSWSFDSAANGRQLLEVTVVSLPGNTGGDEDNDGPGDDNDGDGPGDDNDGPGDDNDDDGPGDDTDDDGQGPDSVVCNKPDNRAAILTTWSSEFGGSQRLPWPQRGSSENYVSAPEGDGKAIVFTTDDREVSGAINNLFLSGSAFFQQASIAPCQADWGDDVPDNCKWVGNSSSNGILWSTKDNEDRSKACRLEKNTRYYLNLGWTDGCTRCVHRLRIPNPNFSP